MVSGRHPTDNGQRTTDNGRRTDLAGRYWVAAVRGSAVLRFTPDGALDRRIDLPVAKPSLTAFGGSDLGTLFVTSIGGGGSHARIAAEPLGGDVFAIDPGVTGLPAAPFAGT